MVFIFMTNGHKDTFYNAVILAHDLEETFDYYWHI